MSVLLPMGILALGFGFASHVVKGAAPAAGGAKPPAGAGGGGGAPPPPQGPPGLTYTLPKVGELYRPNVHLETVRAQDFRGRAAIEEWVAMESPGDSPPERLANILRMLEADELDEPSWIRIPVRGGLEVEVTGDIVSHGGVRLCGPMAAAQAIADHWGALIITPAISDAIWKAAWSNGPARFPLSPNPVGWEKTPGGVWVNPGGAVPWLLYYADRVASDANAVALAKFASGGPGAIAPPLLLSTLSKDYVLVPELVSHPAQCSIYGLQTPTLDAKGNWSGGFTVIQSPVSGASFIHHLAFYDYSHGMRFARRRCWLNGTEADLADVYRKQSDLVNHLPGLGPCPIRHPAIPQLGDEA